MSVNNARSSTPWGSVLLSGVQVICKTQRPSVADDIVASTAITADVNGYDYDFIRERQVIADHEDYLAVKTRTECSRDRALGSSNSALARSVLQAPSDVNPSTDIVQEAGREASVACTPLAATHLLTDQVLQPQKTSTSEEKIKQNSRSLDRHTPVTSNDLVAIDFRKQFSSYCLNDFDANTDDPFLSVELKTINDLEELRKVLSDTALHSSSIGVSYSQSSPSSRPDHVLFTGTESSTDHPATTPTLSDIKEISFPSMAACKRYTRLTQPSPTVCSLPSDSLAKPFPYVHSPDLQTSAHWSKQCFAKLQRPASTGPYATPLPHQRRPPYSPTLPRSCSNDQVVTFMSGMGFPESRIHHLLHLNQYFHAVPPQTGRKPTSQSSDTPSVLLKQLQMVDKILLTYNKPNGVSEATAIVAAAAYHSNPQKCQRFLQLMRELVSLGHPAESTRCWLLATDLDRDLTLKTLQHKVSSSGLPSGDPTSANTCHGRAE